VATVERLHAQKDKVIVATGLSDRDKTLTKLREFVESATPQDSVKLRAVELLGKSAGLFKNDVVVTNIIRSPEEIEQEILTRLKALQADPEPQHIPPGTNLPVKQLN